MKKYIRNPKHTEIRDVRSKKRQEAIERENEQQDEQASEKDEDVGFHLRQGLRE